MPKGFDFIFDNAHSKRKAHASHNWNEKSSVIISVQNYLMVDYKKLFYNL